MTLFINTADQKIIEVALKKDGEVVDKMSAENEYGSQALLPLIEKLLEKNNCRMEELTAIEVNPGPGSFTGLRVGASVAQALGFALNIPVNGQLNKPVELRYT